jgi:hypothetical protein
VTAYATEVEVRAWADFYGVALPDDVARLIALASGDVARFLAAHWDVTTLEPEQVAALADATAVQAIFRAQQGRDAGLGIEDGVSSVGGISFSLRMPVRFSPQASELLAGQGLLLRSGTLPPDIEVVDVPPTP